MHQQQSTTVLTVSEYSEALLAGIQNLLPQLTQRPADFTADDLKTLIRSDHTELFIALHGDSGAQAIGMLTLVTFKTPTGYIARIEDVIVDTASRNKGIGIALMNAAMEHARNLQITKMELTSNGKRVAANSLYRKLGFRMVDTNVFRMSLNAF